MKLPYFDLKDALGSTIDDLKNGSGIGNLRSTPELLGKTVANVGMLAVEAGVAVAKAMPEIVKNMNQNTHEKAKQHLESHGSNMSEADKVKFNEIIRKTEANMKNRAE